jgi:Short C-terminal domain/Phospholipase_D-nuclease N-terminal
MSFLEVVGSIFWFMLLVAWFWLIIVVIGDLFRDRELSGWAKALWCIFVIVLPWLGILVYLIARGRSMNERAQREAQESEKVFRRYVRDAAAGAPSISDEISKLAELRERGTITAEDFESAKSQLLRGAAPVTTTDGRPQQPTAGSTP